MIQGRVVGLQARVDVILRRVGQPDVRLECVIDTGFEGALTLPAAAVVAPDLPYLAGLTADLADGTALLTGRHLGIDFTDGGAVRIDPL